MLAFRCTLQGLSWLFGASLLAGTSYAAPADQDVSINRNIRFSLVVENPGSASLTDKSVWIYGPVARTATQELRALDINTPHRIMHDAIGNTIIELEHLTLGPYESRVITVHAQLEMRSQPAPETAPADAAFLAPQPFVEVDDPGIRAVSAQLRGSDAATSAKTIFEWVQSHIHYAGYIADELGAKYALENRRGDCTEFADLSVAMSRSLGIPARVLGGYFLENDAVLRARDYHNWADVLVGGRWTLLDAQRGYFRERSDQYVTFHIITPGLSNEMRGAERFHVDSGLVVHWN